MTGPNYIIYVQYGPTASEPYLPFPCILIILLPMVVHSEFACILSQ